MSITRISTANNQLASVSNKQTRQDAILAGSNLKALEEDSVQLTGKKKVKKTIKILTLLGAISVGAVALWKHNNTKKTHQFVKDIFLEEFSAEDAKVIKKKYKDILKIKDKDEFIENAVKELKKDYKIDDIDIKLDKHFKAGEKGKNSALAAAARHTYDPLNGNECIHVDSSIYDKKTLLGQMTHELRHAKQQKLMYQVATDDELMRGHAMRNLWDVPDKEKENVLEEFMKDKEVSSRLKNIVNTMKKHYKGISKIDKNDKNYEWGRKILKSHETFANVSEETYQKTFYEIDAKEAQEKMLRLIKW